jgi:hypothetical protein
MMGLRSSSRYGDPIDFPSQYTRRCCQSSGCRRTGSSCTAIPEPVALGSALLLALFGIAMAISFGVKSPLDYSVFSASAAAALLALHHNHGRGPIS